MTLSHKNHHSNPNLMNYSVAMQRNAVYKYFHMQLMVKRICQIKIELHLDDGNRYIR